MKSFLIIGLGNFGASVAEALADAGHEVRALDVSAERVERVAQSLRQVRIGDGTDPAVLREMAAGEVGAAVISTGSDVTASALAAVELQDLGISEIYAKVTSELHARILDKIGVTETVFPERESALRLGKALADPKVLRYMELSPGVSAQEIVTPESWRGRTLRSLGLPRRHQVMVIARRDGRSGEVMPVPDPDLELAESDSLLVAGPEAELAKVAKLR
jgi:trk system potassium uptake protein TrkA